VERGDPQIVRDEIVSGGNVVFEGGGRGVNSRRGENRWGLLTIGVRPGWRHGGTLRAHEDRRPPGLRSRGLRLGEGPVHVDSHPAPQSACPLLSQGAVLVGERGTGPMTPGDGVGGRRMGEGRRHALGLEVWARGSELGAGD
jgi:hypothetical protein